MTGIWIDEQVFCELGAEASRTYPNETGGVLVGYFADGQQPVVLAAVGPGPAATHQRDRFFPDHRWQCEQLDKLYFQSSGLLVYLGDWHTHPDSSPRMSWLDKRTILSIAKHSPARCAQPVMLIGGGNPSGWMWMAHRYQSDQMLGLWINCEILDIRQFVSKSSTSP